MSTKLYVGIIMGKGQKANGALLGLRALMEEQESIYPDMEFASAEYDNPQQITGIVEGLQTADRAILIGHSFGGDEAIHVAGGVPTINDLIAIDPKPRNFFDWINPVYAYSAPPIAGNCIAFFGGFGRPFEYQPDQAGVSNVEMTGQYTGISGHPLIPSAPNVQQYIRDRIKLHMGAA